MPFVRNVRTGAAEAARKQEIAAPEPTPLAERIAGFRRDVLAGRVAFPADLTGFVFGDPPAGRSALDQMGVR